MKFWSCDCIDDGGGGRSTNNGNSAASVPHTMFERAANVILQLAATDEGNDALANQPVNANQDLADYPLNDTAGRRVSRSAAAATRPVGNRLFEALDKDKHGFTLERDWLTMEYQYATVEREFLVYAYQSHRYLPIFYTLFATVCSIAGSLALYLRIFTYGFIVLGIIVASWVVAGVLLAQNRMQHQELAQQQKERARAELRNRRYQEARSFRQRNSTAAQNDTAEAGKKTTTTVTSTASKGTSSRRRRPSSDRSAGGGAAAGGGASTARMNENRNDDGEDSEQDSDDLFRHDRRGSQQRNTRRSSKPQDASTVGATVSANADDLFASSTVAGTSSRRSGGSRRHRRDEKRSGEREDDSDDPIDDDETLMHLELTDLFEPEPAERRVIPLDDHLRNSAASNPSTIPAPLLGGASGRTNGGGAMSGAAATAAMLTAGELRARFRDCAAVHEVLRAVVIATNIGFVIALQGSKGSCHYLDVEHRWTDCKAAIQYEGLAIIMFLASAYLTPIRWTRFVLVSSMMCIIYFFVWYFAPSFRSRRDETFPKYYTSTLILFCTQLVVSFGTVYLRERARREDFEMFVRRHWEAEKVIEARRGHEKILKTQRWREIVIGAIPPKMRDEVHGGVFGFGQKSIVCCITLEGFGAWSCGRSPCSALELSSRVMASLDAIRYHMSVEAPQKYHTIGDLYLFMETAADRSSRPEEDEEGTSRTSLTADEEVEHSMEAFFDAAVNACLFITVAILTDLADERFADTSLMGTHPLLSRYCENLSGRVRDPSPVACLKERKSALAPLRLRCSLDYGAAGGILLRDAKSWVAAGPAVDSAIDNARASIDCRYRDRSQRQRAADSEISPPLSASEPVVGSSAMQSFPLPIAVGRNTATLFPWLEPENRGALLPIVLLSPPFVDRVPLTCLGKNVHDGEQDRTLLKSIQFIPKDFMDPSGATASAMATSTESTGAPPASQGYAPEVPMEQRSNPPIATATANRNAALRQFHPNLLAKLHRCDEGMDLWRTLANCTDPNQSTASRVSGGDHSESSAAWNSSLSVPDSSLRASPRSADFFYLPVLLGVRAGAPELSTSVPLDPQSALAVSLRQSTSTDTANSVQGGSGGGGGAAALSSLRYNVPAREEFAVAPPEYDTESAATAAPAGDDEQMPGAFAFAEPTGDEDPPARGERVGPGPSILRLRASIVGGGGETGASSGGQASHRGSGASANPLAPPNRGSTSRGGAGLSAAGGPGPRELAMRSYYQKLLNGALILVTSQHNPHLQQLQQQQSQAENTSMVTIDVAAAAQARKELFGALQLVHGWFHFPTFRDSFVEGVYVSSFSDEDLPRTRLAYLWFGFSFALTTAALTIVSGLYDTLKLHHGGASLEHSMGLWLILAFVSSGLICLASCLPGLADRSRSGSPSQPSNSAAGVQPSAADASGQAVGPLGGVGPFGGARKSSSMSASFPNQQRSATSFSQGMEMSSTSSSRNSNENMLRDLREISLRTVVITGLALAAWSFYTTAVMVAPKRTVIGDSQVIFLFICLSSSFTRPESSRPAIMVIPEVFLCGAYLLRTIARFEMTPSIRNTAIFLEVVCVLYCVLIRYVLDSAHRKSFATNVRIFLLENELKEETKRLETVFEILAPTDAVAKLTELASRPPGWIRNTIDRNHYRSFDEELATADRNRVCGFLPTHPLELMRLVQEVPFCLIEFNAAPNSTGGGIGSSFANASASLPPTNMSLSAVGGASSTSGGTPGVPYTATTKVPASSGGSRVGTGAAGGSASFAASTSGAAVTAVQAATSGLSLNHSLIVHSLIADALNKGFNNANVSILRADANRVLIGCDTTASIAFKKPSKRPEESDLCNTLLLAVQAIQSVLENARKSAAIPNSSMPLDDLLDGKSFGVGGGAGGNGASAMGNVMDYVLLGGSPSGVAASAGGAAATGTAGGGATAATPLTPSNNNNNNNNNNHNHNHAQDASSAATSPQAPLPALPRIQYRMILHMCPMLPAMVGYGEVLSFGYHGAGLASASDALALLPWNSVYGTTRIIRTALTHKPCIVDESGFASPHNSPTPERAAPSSERGTAVSSSKRGRPTVRTYMNADTGGDAAGFSRGRWSQIDDGSSAAGLVHLMTVASLTGPARPPANARKKGAGGSSGSKQHRGIDAVLTAQYAPSVPYRLKGQMTWWLIRVSFREAEPSDELIERLLA